MPHFICTTCGTQFPESDAPPPRCPVCEDERQYVPASGQAWTTLAELGEGHRNRFEEEGPGLIGIGSEPSFAIGQRALLVRTRSGNVLWDCVTLLDDETVRHVEDMGGLSAIAISHPHYYTTMVEWAHAFGVSVHLHEDDAEWIMRPDPCIRLWSGRTFALSGECTLLRLGGHFPGGQVLHWPAGEDGAGALLTGDIIQVVQDTRWVSFMYSYPNLIPLPAREVRRIAAAVEPLEFARIYGAWWGRNVLVDAKGAVRRSADRYVRALGGV